MVEILKLMLGRYSEDEIWSRFVFELVIWTQPWGPLCLWQCFCTQSLFLLDRFSPLVCILVRECLYLSLALHKYYYKKVSTQKDKWSQNHLILTEVKINGANEDMIVAACEQFGDKSDEEVTKKETCKSQKMHLCSGDKYLPGNNGGPPKGDYGKHDCGGDISGQENFLNQSLWGKT